MKFEPLPGKILLKPLPDEIEDKVKKAGFLYGGSQHRYNSGVIMEIDNRSSKELDIKKGDSVFFNKMFFEFEVGNEHFIIVDKSDIRARYVNR
jgi:co-chaperonin GroES (HSP10)